MSATATQETAGVRRPAGDLHVRTDRSRQGLEYMIQAMPGSSPRAPRPSI